MMQADDFATRQALAIDKCERLIAWYDDRGKRGWAQFTYPERHPGPNLPPLPRNSICRGGVRGTVG
jgi:hypothetical protein